MKKIFLFLLCVGILPIATTSSFAEIRWGQGFDPKMIARTNQKLEKVMPIVERQGELLIKMIGNDKYRAKLEPEFAKVIGSLPTRMDDVRKNWSSWDAGQKLSFLASVLKQYKAPLTKTCIVGEVRRGGHQPLNWTFPLEFLGGSMFPRTKSESIGFGVADLRKVDKAELIRMSNLANQIVELQKMLRDGIEDKFDDDALQEFTSYEKSGGQYRMYTHFGLEYNRPKKPCAWYAGKKIARGKQNAIGYEIIVPGEIAASSKIYMYVPVTSFGGGAAKQIFDEMPSEYINAWKNLITYYQEYLPFLPEDRFYKIIEHYDAALVAKTDEPLGDLMSEDAGSGGDSSKSDDSDLALPSLD